MSVALDPIGNSPFVEKIPCCCCFACKKGRSIRYDEAFTRNRVDGLAQFLHSQGVVEHGA